MSLKSIEMQVALPRTQEFGKKQEQINQRSMINQHLDAEEKILKAEQDRHRSEKINYTENNKVNAEDKQSKQDQQQKRKQKQKKVDADQAVKHPFKGKHIDLSL